MCSITDVALLSCCLVLFCCAPPQIAFLFSSNYLRQFFWRPQKENKPIYIILQFDNLANVSRDSRETANQLTSPGPIYYSLIRPQTVWNAGRRLWEQSYAVLRKFIGKRYRGSPLRAVYAGWTLGTRYRSEEGWASVLLRIHHLFAFMLRAICCRAVWRHPIVQPRSTGQGEGWTSQQVRESYILIYIFS